MQTRKRAKSVSFGKKDKEKEEVKKTAEDEVVSSESHKASEKAEIVESKEVHEKPHFELSDTPPKESEPEESPVETPANEFVTDSPQSFSPELPKSTKEEAENQEVDSSTESEPIEISSHAPAVEEAGEQDESHELSPTLPPSAFTIQSNEQPNEPPASTPVSVPEGGKKRFGLYFIVVAFLSFILGLGAMAAASYLGFVNANLPKLPSGMQVPAILGQKPTPTIPPPTATPTQKPVDLAAFTISIQNGSGISGKAATEKTALTTAGFKVTSTGNADKSTYTKTEIAAKKSVDPAFLSKLETELKKSFDVDTTVTTSPASSPSDVTVTLGSQSAK